MARKITLIEGAPPTSQPPPRLHVCRQSVDSDLPDVEALQTPLTKLVFRDVDLRNCIEKNMCKTLVNEDNEIVAFLVVMDCPNIPALAHCSWINWIRRFYRVDFASPWNTLFIHYMVWDSRYPKFLSSALKALYKNNRKLEQILMVTPPKTQLLRELEETLPWAMFTPVYPSVQGVYGTGGTLSQVQTLLLNLRHSVLPKLTVRKAAEEDNIDVQPIVQYQFEVLKFVYGDFKLGNVIDLKTPSKAVLVAEKGHSVTVGVLSLSTEVNYNKVNFFFHHVLDITSGENDAEFHSDTLRLEFPQGVHFTPETFLEEEEQLSMVLNMENQQIVTEEVDEEEDREDLAVYLDVDGDTFRVVDPVMEYLLQARQKDAYSADLEDESSITIGSYTARQSMDYTYWGRLSLSPSLLQQDSVWGRALSFKDDQQNSSYTGIPPDNAFIITLLALHPDLDVRYAFDMLEASFECFPDKYFCLLNLPTIYQGSPLTQHMVRMVPKMLCDFPHELYVTHRNATFSEFTVRSVSVVDIGGIYELVQNISQGKEICRDITSILLHESPGVMGFILESGENIVGVAVISDNFGLHQMQPHYNIEDLIQLRLYDQEVHGLIRHLILCPIFLKSGPFFLRQIMHLAGLQTISYCLLNDDINLFKINVSSITVLGDLIPVSPRKRIQYDLKALDIFTPEYYVMHQELEFALFIATEKLLSIPKLELNYRIVVVGASDTAMSFLENLIFRSARKHVIYNNIMLVSVQGFPLELKSHLAGDKMIPHSGVYTREYLSSICLSAHVNVLYGALSVINRKEKMICLNEDQWLRYDYLFLLTGMQFCKPRSPVNLPGITKRSSESAKKHSGDSFLSLNDDRDFLKQDCRKNVDIRELYKHSSLECVDNLFVINTATDAVIALGQLMKIIKLKKEGKVVIYGNTLNTYACVESLLVFGVSGHKIALVLMPHTDPSHNCLENNPLVTDIIVQMMQERGVTINTGYSLVHWSLSNKSLEVVMFQNDDNSPLTLDCIALFCYGTKSTSAKTYMAVNDAGIVYNNGIIIDNHFRTNDEYIYAAGPGTRYSNKYKVKEMEHHKYYNSVEIGLKMSKIFRRVVEPQADYPKPPKMTPLTPSQPSEEDTPFALQKSTRASKLDTLPELRDPIIQVTQLPGGWNFVKISAPGRPVPLECQFHGQGDCGPVLITGVPIVPEGPGYFRLCFSIYNTVREVVLLSKKEIPYQNLQKLYGKHESILNNLYKQYYQGFIPDFYAFFSQPWAYAIYTTRFNELERKCADLFVSSDAIGVPLWYSQQQDTIVRNVKADHETLNSRYVTSSVPMCVKHLTLKFISERRLQLPMYYTDAVLASEYQQSYRASPLHQDPARARQKHNSKPS